MPAIAALSETAARAICSTLVLNDAISVIKELIDNALDSCATSITIETSANTLDIIQVKDNGVGIGIEDRRLLCKRGYTSKIRTFDDLTLLGGTFLGFRGEALASIAELSDNLVITTRIDGENVGTLLKFDSRGKLTSSASAAHGTGTTVRVSDFLKSIPVRRQTALRQAGKTLTNIKRLLHDYAFARPTVRFQFKVLKSGSDLKANWSFAPCNDANNLNVLASKIVGKDVASQCKQASVSSDDGTIIIDSLMFEQGADISKCAGADRFVSIDGRPLTVERGLMKDINQTYKSWVRGILPEGISIPHKVFLLLRLQCPKGSYDVNVEPSKNEVMFENSGLVMDLFERLCKDVFGEKKLRESPVKHASRKRTDPATNFNVLLANRPLPGVTKDKWQLDLESSAGNETLDILRVTSLSNGRTNDIIEDMPIGLNSSSANQESHKRPITVEEQTEEDMADQIEDAMNPKVTNPFTLAKINTRIKPYQIPNLQPHQRKTDIENIPISDTAQQRSIMLPSPSPSPTRSEGYQNPGPPNRPWKSRQTQREHEEPESESVEVHKQTSPAHSTLIDRWTESVNGHQHSNSSPASQGGRQLSPSKGNTSSPLKSAIGSISKRTPQKGSGNGLPAYQTPFRTPFRKTGQSPSSLPRSETQLSVGRGVLSENGTSRDPSVETSPETEHARFPGFSRPVVSGNTELDDIMEFEHRKRSTILQHREKDRQHRATKPRRDEESEDVQLFSIPARPENEGLDLSGSDVDYSSKFGSAVDNDTPDIPPQPNSASYTQNPHWNRYRKALRDLDERTTASNSQHVKNVRTNEHESRIEPDDEECSRQSKVEMLPEDPRTYLIRHAKSKAVRDGSKPKRSVTAKLPFETIPAELATYGYLGSLALDGIDGCRQLSEQARALAFIDSYVRKGSIGSELKKGKVSNDIVQMWEAQLQTLLTAADVVQHDKP